MKVTGLDGRVYQLSLNGHQPVSSESGGSEGHARCRELINKLFPLDRRLEEIELPGTKGLAADFFLPNRMAVLEVHGAQHYNFIPFFHKTRLGFLQNQARDAAKKSWCEINSILYVELPHNESDEQWTVRIFAALRPKKADD